MQSYLMRYLQALMRQVEPSKRINSFYSVFYASSTFSVVCQLLLSLKFFGENVFALLQHVEDFWFYEDDGFHGYEETFLELQRLDVVA